MQIKWNKSLSKFCDKMRPRSAVIPWYSNGPRHLDDFAESFLMSAFRNGSLRTMKAWTKSSVEPVEQLWCDVMLCYVSCIQFSWALYHFSKVDSAVFQLLVIFRPTTPWQRRIYACVDHWSMSERRLWPTSPRRTGTEAQPRKLMETSSMWFTIEKNGDILLGVYTVYSHI